MNARRNNYHILMNSPQTHAHIRLPPSPPLNCSAPPFKTKKEKKKHLAPSATDILLAGVTCRPQLLVPVKFTHHHSEDLSDVTPSLLITTWRPSAGQSVHNCLFLQWNKAAPVSLNIKQSFQSYLWDQNFWMGLIKSHHNPGVSRKG